MCEGSGQVDVRVTADPTYLTILLATYNTANDIVAEAAERS